MGAGRTRLPDAMVAEASCWVSQATRGSSAVCAQKWLPSTTCAPPPRSRNMHLTLEHAAVWTVHIFVWPATRPYTCSAATQLLPLHPFQQQDLPLTSTSLNQTADHQLCNSRDTDMRKLSFCHHSQVRL